MDQIKLTIKGLTSTEFGDLERKITGNVKISWQPVTNTLDPETVQVIIENFEKLKDLKEYGDVLQWALGPLGYLVGHLKRRKKFIFITISFPYRYRGKNFTIIITAPDNKINDIKNDVDRYIDRVFAYKNDPDQILIDVDKDGDVSVR